MEAFRAEQGTSSPFVSLNTATVPPFSSSLPFFLSLSLVKYQQIALTQQASVVSALAFAPSRKGCKM